MTAVVVAGAVVVAAVRLAEGLSVLDLELVTGRAARIGVRRAHQASFLYLAMLATDMRGHFAGPGGPARRRCSAPCVAAAATRWRRSRRRIATRCAATIGFVVIDLESPVLDGAAGDDD